MCSTLCKDGANRRTVTITVNAMASVIGISNRPKTLFGNDWASADEDVARLFAMRVEQGQDESDEQHGIAERERHHVADPELSSGRPRLVAKRGERSSDRKLRNDVGAEQDFDQRDDSSGNRDPALGMIGGRVGRLTVRVWKHKTISLPHRAGAALNF